MRAHPLREAPVNQAKIAMALASAMAFAGGNYAFTDSKIAFAE